VITGVRKSSEVMISDAEDGRRVMEELLHTIHKSVIEEIIMGTIGYRWKTDQAFRELFYQKDCCSGIYIVTFSQKGPKDQLGKSLTRKQWALVQGLIER